MIELETVLPWLEAGEWLVESGEEQMEGALWHAQFRKDEGQPTFHVVCEGPDGEAVVIQRVTKIADSHREALSQLSKQEFDSFHYHLSRDFLLLGSQFLVSFEGDTWYFAISRRVWEAHLDREALFSAIKKVQNASSLGVLNVRRTAERERD